MQYWYRILVQGRSSQSSHHLHFLSTAHHKSFPTLPSAPRTVGSQLPQGYIRSPVAQWYARGRRQEPEDRVKIWPCKATPQAADPQILSDFCSYEKLFHVGIFPFPKSNNYHRAICDHGSKIGWNHRICHCSYATIKKFMPHPSEKKVSPTNLG